MRACVRIGGGGDKVACMRVCVYARVLVIETSMIYLTCNGSFSDIYHRLYTVRSVAHDSFYRDLFALFLLVRV